MADSEYYLNQLLGLMVKSAGNPDMPIDVSWEIESLFHFYKQPVAKVGTTIITVEMGMNYGHYTIRPVLEGSKEQPLKYEKGNYDYISLNTEEKTVLFTDFSGEQPFNRQSVYYVGYSWENLNLIQTTNEYREFETKTYPSNTTFGVWGFDLNNFWHYVKFGIAVENDKVADFLSALRTILRKN